MANAEGAPLGGPGDKPSEITRRQALKRGAILGGALAWATPVVQVVGMRPAFAQVASPGTGGFIVVLANGKCYEVSEAEYDCFQANCLDDAVGGCLNACLEVPGIGEYEVHCPE